MAHVFEINNRDPSLRRGPKGYCIYCGAINYHEQSDRKLGDEHVIPEGLGGTLVSEQAACECCEQLVNLFEQAILKTVLYAPRVHLGVRRKRRKRTEDTIKVQGSVAGKDVEMFLPIKHVPVLLFLLTLGPPGILIGRPVDIADIKGAWFIHLSSGPIVPPGFQSFASPIMDTLKFCQFLAKIAHCFAVDSLKNDFTPMLLPLITLEPPVARFDLVGGKVDSDPPSDKLHELELNWVHAGGTYYAVVRIRLFASLGAPTYFAVAGTAKAGVNQHRANIS